MENFIVVVVVVVVVVFIVVVVVVVVVIPDYKSFFKKCLKGRTQQKNDEKMDLSLIEIATLNLLF